MIICFREIWNIIEIWNIVHCECENVESFLQRWFCLGRIKSSLVFFKETIIILGSSNDSHLQGLLIILFNMICLIWFLFLLSYWLLIFAFGNNRIVMHLLQITQKKAPSYYLHYGTLEHQMTCTFVKIPIVCLFFIFETLFSKHL